MPEQRPWTLEITDGIEPPRLLTLDPAATPWTLGRSAQADIQLDLPTVSRLHAKLSRSADTWKLEDLASRGGTLVNGQRITTTQAITPHDRITISRYRLRLIDPARPIADPDAEPAHEATLISDDADQPEISVLTQMTAPRLDTSHIAALSDFGRELMQIDDAQQRLDRLCAVVAGDLIRGRWALALQVDAEQTNKPPKLLASHPKNIQKTTDLHISRSTLRAMQKANAPVLSSNFAKSGSGVVEMSIVSSAPATAAIACPLSDEPGSHTLLYVNLPPMLGSTEWLALVALAVKQYQQADALWAARTAIAARAAVQRDLDNAKRIQQSILPKPRDLGPLAVAWSYLPCDTIGGDLVDVIAMPDGRILLLIADVTGHGLQAALTTLSVHSIVQTSIRGGASLDDTLARLNDHLCEYLPDGRFVTLAALTLDPTTGQTQCICAGHHPPAVYSAHGNLRDLNAASEMVLGIIPMQPTAAHDQLAPGDTLLLSTDGLTELPDAQGNMLGIEGVNRLVGELRSERGLTTAELTNMVQQRFTSIQGDRPMLDDQTFLLASWQG